jgi:DNA repair exonuclease SbcCD ATPase subunit
VKGYVHEADPNRAIVQRRLAWARSRDDQARAQAEVDRLVDRVKAGRAALRQAEAALAELEAARAGAATRADEAKVALALWQTVERAARARSALQARKDALRAEQAANPRPVAPPGYVPVDDVQREELARYRADAAWHRRFLEALATGVTTCPTCGTAVDDLAAAIAESREELPFLEGEIARLGAHLRAAGDHEERLGRWQTWREGFRQRADQLRADLARLAGELPPPAETRDDLRRDVDRAAALERALADARGAVTSLARGVEKLTGQWEATRAQVEDALSRRREDRVRREVYEPAAAALAAATARIRERGRLLGEIDARRERVALDLGMLGRLEAEERAMARARALVAHLGAIRGVLHRDALPRVVARSYLGLIEGQINALLDQFDAGFLVAAGEDLAFTARFHDGRRQPAARLSGGQKVLLSLAFRVAVNIYFTGDIGMLTLDEGTWAGTSPRSRSR